MFGEQLKYIIPIAEQASTLPELIKKLEQFNQKRNNQELRILINRLKVQAIDMISKLDCQSKLNNNNVNSTHQPEQDPLKSLVLDVIAKEQFKEKLGLTDDKVKVQPFYDRQDLVFLRIVPEQRQQILDNIAKEFGEGAAKATGKAEYIQINKPVQDLLGAYPKGPMFADISEQVKQKLQQRSLDRHFAIDEIEWEFAKAYFNRYNTLKLDKKEFRIGGKHHDFTQYFCKQRNLQINRFLAKLDHSFYQNTKQNDIVAVKAKHHYMKEKNVLGTENSLIPIGTFGKFRLGISYNTGNYTGVMVKRVTLNKTQQKQQENINVSFQDYVDGEDLFKWIQTEQEHSDLEKYIVAANLSKEVLRLQKLNIVHNDIKPENIIIDKDLNVTLIDYGLAIEISSGLDSTILENAIGTPFYMAPEMYNYSICSYQTDSWSFAMALIFLLGVDANSKTAILKNHPFAEIDILWGNESLQHCLERNLSNIDKDISKELYKFYSHDPNLRPQIMGLLNILENKILKLQMKNKRELDINSKRALEFIQRLPAGVTNIYKDKSRGQYLVKYNNVHLLQQIPADIVDKVLKVLPEPRNWLQTLFGWMGFKSTTK